MDQVKQYLQLLKKHHFWVLCAVGAIVGFVCWWTGAKRLAAETDTRKKTVTASFKAVTDASKKSNPPNQDFEKGVTDKNDVLKKEVLAEWRKQYEAQQALFEWPENVQQQVANLKLEDNRAFFKSNEIFLEELQKRVFELADYRRFPVIEGAEAGNPAGAGRNPQPQLDPNAEPIDLLGLVVWDPTHREQLETRYQLRRHPGDPTELSIRIAQEDIWMLENMAQVIRKTNEGALDVIAAPIKRIDSMEVAQWAINEAVRAAPKVIADAKTDAGTGDMSRMAAASTGAPPPAGAGPGGVAGATVSAADLAKASDAEILNGRYLNEQGQPLDGTAAQPYAELKLLLVRLEVVIDQRKIPNLLANCANAAIPIEPMRVNWWPVGGNKESGGMGGAARGFAAAAASPPMAGPLSRGSAPGGGGRFGPSSPSRGNDQAGGFKGFQPQPAFGGAAGAGGAASDPTKIEQTVWDVTLEVCGLVQIYNLPDEEKLGTGSSTSPGKRPSAVPTTVVALPRGTGSGGNDFRGGGRFNGGFGGR